MDFANVRIVTPPLIKVRFAALPATLEAGSTLTVEMNQFGWWMPWDISVREVVPNQLLVDEQSGRGPFRAWRHEHHFIEENGTTILMDRIEYELPFGLLGRAVDALLMQFIQRRVFAYRHLKTIEYFRRR
jgi:ligand-binding SRPBCC domain-containing protein